jgi:hypothetical protein
MSDGFISYSRKDKEFIRKLHDVLEQADLSVWADWQDIPLTADWWQEIQTGIESANNFIAIISPDYVTSEVVKDEIEYAVRCNKRLIPILYRESDANRIHSALKKINWLFFREGNDFEKAVRSLIQSINPDLEHVSEHTRLLENAVRWQQKERDDSLLLHGRALEEAEQRLTFSSESFYRRVKRCLLDSDGQDTHLTVKAEHFGAYPAYVPKCSASHKNGISYFNGVCSDLDYGDY